MSLIIKIHVPTGRIDYTSFFCSLFRSLGASLHCLFNSRNVLRSLGHDATKSDIIPVIVNIGSKTMTGCVRFSVSVN